MIHLFLLEVNLPSIIRQDGGIERGLRRKASGGRDLALERRKYLSWRMGSRTWREKVPELENGLGELGVYVGSGKAYVRQYLAALNQPCNHRTCTILSTSSSYTFKMAPLDLSLPTALLLIDNQSGFCHPETLSHWGTTRSNPFYEINIQALLTAFRAARSTSQAPLEVIHIFHSSVIPESPLHPLHPAQGIRPLDFAIPASDGSEPGFWKSVNSSFIGTKLESHLREKGIRQLVIAGLTTDHCVSTTTRMAANLGVVDRFLGGPVKLNSDGTHEKDVSVDKGRIVLVADATATFGKCGIDSETVHKVSVASLDGEFADVLGTEEVVKALRKVAH